MAVVSPTEVARKRLRTERGLAIRIGLLGGAEPYTPSLLDLGRCLLAAVDGAKAA